jgi:hypothetical protein
VIIQTSFVIGPMVGGYLTDEYDSEAACILMVWLSMSIVALYAVFNLVIFCLSKWDAPEVDLDVSMESDAEVSMARSSFKGMDTSDADFRKTMHDMQARKRKNDDLGTLLKVLTENSEDGKTSKRKTKNSQGKYLPQVTEHENEEEKLVKKNI